MNHLYEELIYKKWVRENTPNMVPPYATSIEGGGCLVLSPDGSEVMLVHEYGRWGRCGGAVDPGESSLETALREVSEETQIELDLERVNPVRIGISYHQPRSRDGRVNDNFVLFIVYAKKRNRDKDITIDHNELSDARWFSIEKLVGEFRKKIDDKNSNEAIKSKEMGKTAASALGPHCEQLSFTDQAFNVPHRFQFEIEEKPFQNTHELIISHFSQFETSQNLSTRMVVLIKSVRQCFGPHSNKSS